MNTLRKIFLRLFLRLHKVAISFGVFILPVHYYVSVPNIVELSKEKHLWSKKSLLPGLDTTLDRQVLNLRTICLPYQTEYNGNSTYLEAVRLNAGPGFGYLEAQALHSIIRHYHPRTILEVGAGVSTYCVKHATELNSKENAEGCRIISIDPYPSDFVRKMSNIELIPKKVQEIPLDIFEQLTKNDLLFIDSSHTVKTGSDVNYLVLEVLPRLRPGVIVHFHDIFLPYDYQRDALQTLFHWSETSLLRAFLINNVHVEILFCMSMLHYDRKNNLKEVFPEYSPQADDDGLHEEGVKPFDYPRGEFPASLYFITK